MDSRLDHDIRVALRAGHSRQAVAKSLGMTLAELEQRIRATYMAAHELGLRRLADRAREPDPTPEEIAERAAIERQSWSEHEYYRRSIGLPPDWTPPMCSVRGSSD